LPISPNNYLNNIKHLKQYQKEEEEKKENIVQSNSTDNVQPKASISDEVKDTPSFYSV